MDSASLLTSFEHCQLKGYWNRDWERASIDFNELLNAGIKEGLTTDRPDHGEAAGERIIEISANKEIAKECVDIYASAYHHAAIVDVVCCAVRKPSEPPWGVPEPVRLSGDLQWTPACFLAPDGSHLRRVIFVSSWSDNRHYHEARSWFSLGETCIFGLPMQEIIVILGPFRDGKRHGHWSKGVQHPQNKKLRFRRRNFISEGFKESWLSCWREDHDEIDSKTWLQGMLDDGVLQESLFVVDVPVPIQAQRERITDLARRKLEKIMTMKEQPDQCLSVCDWPQICPHKNHCWANEPPSGRFGFVRINY